MARRKAGDVIIWKTSHGFLAKGKVIRDERSGYLVEYEGKEVFVPDIAYSLANPDSFSNGRSRAEAYLNQRMKAVNIGTPTDKDYILKDKNSGKQVGTIKATSDADAIAQARNKYGKRMDMMDGDLYLFLGSQHIYM